jgi:probable HAF family extracellular repeat protein
LVLVAPNGIKGAEPTITTFDIPGATNTIPLSINADGVIVGRYLMAGRTHGFVRSPSGDLATIDVPDSSLTVAAAINNRGDIVGMYAVPSAPTQRHGFLLQDGEFTTLDPPGSTFTNALGINERGDIVGRYCTLDLCPPSGNGAFHAFLLQDGVFTTIDVPDAQETHAFGINDRGQIVGAFLTADSHVQIFVLTDGQYSAIVPPGGQNVSLDKGGINERGEVVGFYCDVGFQCGFANGTHGFLHHGNRFTTIDIPGALATVAFGINARGDIVGGYLDAHDGRGVHGFLLSRGRD